MNVGLRQQLWVEYWLQQQWNKILRCEINVFNFFEFIEFNKQEENNVTLENKLIFDSITNKVVDEPENQEEQLRTQVLH